MGEEAVATGVCGALNEEDYIGSTHRGHGHLIARGADINRMMAEILGKKTGYSRGKGGSMHIMSAASLEAVKKSADFGVIDTDVSGATLDMKKVQKRKAGVVSQLVGGVGALMRSNGVTVENGEGVLTDAHTINVGGKNITAADVIIATGSVSKSLPVSISDKMEVITSTEMLDLDDIPGEMVIIGGGVIGVEFAYFLSTIGTKVTIVEFLDRIINMAPIVIALGPGFSAGEDCDAVVETKRGHYLGKVIYDGPAEANTGIPGNIGGYTHERVVHEPCLQKGESQ